MDDHRKTKKELIAELASLRSKLTQLENPGPRISGKDGAHQNSNGDPRQMGDVNGDIYYRALVEQAADGIIVSDPGGNILKANQASLHMLGYSLDEITQLNLSALIPPEDRETQPLKLKELNRGDPVLNERRFVRKDGEIVPVEVNAKQLPDGNLQGILRDISERIGTEAALQKSDGRNRALLAALPDLIFRFDREGVFLDYHAPEEGNNLLLPPNAFIGKAIDDVMPPEVAAAFHHALNRALNTNTLERFEYELDMPEGHRVYEARMTVSGPDEIMVVVRDITRQKRMEADLRISENRYRNTIEQSPYSIVIYSPDGQALKANPAAREVWNVTTAGLDHILATYNVLEDQQLEALGLMPFLKQAFAGEPTRLPAIKYDVEHTPDPTAVSDTPDKYWVQGYVYPIKDENGNVREVVVIHEDITKQKQAEEALRISEERFRELADHIREVFWLFDWTEQRVLYVSPAYERVWGRSIEALYERYEEWGESIHLDDVDYAAESFLEITKNGGGQEREYRIIRPDGEVRWVSDRGFAIRDEEGQIKHIAGIADDITERKRAEAVLKESEEKFRALAEQSPNMIFINQNGRVVYVNRRCEEIMGYSIEEICSPTFDFLRLVAPEDRNIVRWSFGRHIQGKEVEPLEYRLVKKDGSALEVVVNTRLMDYQGDKAILGTVTDISRQKQVENKLAFIASHDTLTGLPNRMALDQRLEQALGQADRRDGYLALMLLDLDNFKDINDTFGHPTGDELLQAVGNRLLKVLRKSDTVARIGGDEFMLLLPDLEDFESTAIVSKKVLETFHRPFVLDGHETSITTSIGIAQYPQDGEDVQSLKKHADIALYQAKDAGRDNFQFYSTEKRLSIS